MNICNDAEHLDGAVLNEETQICVGYDVGGQGECNVCAFFI